MGAESLRAGGAYGWAIDAVLGNVEAVQLLRPSWPAAILAGYGGRPRRPARALPSGAAPGTSAGRPRPGAVDGPGTLVVLDISGFTRLTERLAARGRAGAEELSDVLDDVFGPLVEAGLAEGCDLLKWGGDAVLLLAAGPHSAVRAARAAALMRAVLSRVGHLRTSVGPVVLRASTGVATGDVHLVLAGDPGTHRELMVLGPVASRVTAIEAAAAAGQVLVDAATAALLPARSWATRRVRASCCGASRRRRGRRRRAAPTRARRPDLTARRSRLRGLLPAPGGPTTDRSQLVPSQLRTHVAHGHPRARAPRGGGGLRPVLRHRRPARAGGPDALTAAVDELVRTVQDATDQARRVVPRDRHRRRRRQGHAGGRRAPEHG